MSRTEISHRVHRQWRLVSGGGALALGILLGVVIMLRGNTALGIDDEWLEEIEESRSPWLEVPSYLMDLLGGGLVATILALALTILLIVLKRPWTAAFVATASLLSLGIVQALKRLLDRDRPEEIMLSLESGAFPSGHVANAATLAALLAIIIWRWWIVAIGAVYVALMAMSRTYLYAHWLSDTAGGLLIGAGVVLILWAPFANKVLSERPSSR